MPGWNLDALPRSPIPPSPRCRENNIGVSFVTAKNSGKNQRHLAGLRRFQSDPVVSYLRLPSGGLTASAGNGQVIQNWNPVANASGYYVKESLVSGGSYTVIYTNLTNTTFTTPGLATEQPNTMSSRHSSRRGAGANSIRSQRETDNVPPVISWVIPTNNSTFIHAEALTLTASATDADGTVDQCGFFNGTKPAWATSPAAVGNQYSLTWTTPRSAAISLNAVVTGQFRPTNNPPPHRHCGAAANSDVARNANQRPVPPDVPRQTDRITCWQRPQSGGLDSGVDNTRRPMDC